MYVGEHIILKTNRTKTQIQIDATRKQDRYLCNQLVFSGINDYNCYRLGNSSQPHVYSNVKGCISFK